MRPVPRHRLYAPVDYFAYRGNGERDIGDAARRRAANLAQGPIMINAVEAIIDELAARLGFAEESR